MDASSSAITQDAALTGQVTLFQPKDGYRFALDSILLAHFSEKGKGYTVLDLCAGCGVVGLVMLSKGHAGRIVAVEKDEQLHGLCIKNAQANSVEENYKAVKGDYRSFAQPKERFEVIVANPPFHPHGSGRLNPNPQIASARHEVDGSMRDLIKTAARCLSPSGSLYLVYPAYRLQELAKTLGEHRFNMARYRAVHPLPKAEATMILVEATRNKGRLSIEPPLIVHEGEGVYTPEADAILTGNW